MSVFGVGIGLRGRKSDLKGRNLNADRSGARSRAESECDDDHWYGKLAASNSLLSTLAIVSKCDWQVTGCPSLHIRHDECIGKRDARSSQPNYDLDSQLHSESPSFRCRIGLVHLHRRCFARKTIRALEIFVPPVRLS